jgi:hypothetical protein
VPLCRQEKDRRLTADDSHRRPGLEGESTSFLGARARFDDCPYWETFRQQQREEAATMARCDQMKVGEIYACDQCGFEFQVIKECVHQDEMEHDGSCEASGFSCCGDELKLKGHGTGEVRGTSPQWVTQPAMGSGA